MPAKAQAILTASPAAIRESVDSLDPASRLDEFRDMQDGWLDGYGYAPSPRGLDWLSSSLKRRYAADAPSPYIYPTPEGGVSLEWSIGPHRASLEIDLDTREAEWHCLNLATDHSYERDLQLDAPQDWAWLANEVRGLGDSTS